MLDQRLTVLTIGADDLPLMKEFYEGIFGWKPLTENKNIIFYKLNGFLFSIAKKKHLAGFIGMNPEGNGFRAVTMGYNVDTREEVLALYQAIKAKGVEVVAEPTEPPFGGLFFYFRDVEGNILEIASNPYIVMDNSHNVRDHKSIAGL